MAFDRPSLRIPIAIALGAIAGALARYYLGLGMTAWLGDSFPWGTFAANVTGCCGMGFVAHFPSRRFTLSPEIRLLVATGFLGSYTTFSSYALDTHALILEPSWLADGLYYLGSPTLGGMALYLGAALAGLIAR